MKRYLASLLAALALAAVAVPASAAQVSAGQSVTSASSGNIVPCGVGVYCGNWVNGNLNYSTTFLLDLNQYRAQRVSVQANFSTATLATASVSEGQKCAGSLTIASNAGVINPGVTITGCGRTFVSGTDFAVNVTYSSMTAKNLKDALSAACGALTVTQTAGQSVVYATSTLDSSSACNFSSSNYGYVSTSAITTGIDSGFAIGSANIYSANHGLVTGTAVLLGATDTSKIPSGLSNQTTYYAYKLTDSYLQLMAAKADAIVGANGIVAASTFTNTSAPSVTLAPLAWSGSGTFILQVSNDNSSWGTAPSTGTVTATNATGATSLFDDFGVLGYRYLRLNYTAPTQGALNLVAPVVLRP